jgi:hypothetical protein
MTVTIQSSIVADTAADDRVFRKVFRRLIWFLFILLVVSFMDRINIAFAALTMNKDLGLSAAAFGMSLTVFYAAYTLCEIPSNLMLAKVGARLWIARIMITWGLASAATRRIGNRSNGRRLSQRFDRELHLRARLCCGDADHGRDLHRHRDRADARYDPGAEPEHRLSAAPPQLRL